MNVKKKCILMKCLSKTAMGQPFDDEPKESKVMQQD